MSHTPALTPVLAAQLPGCWERLSVIAGDSVAQIFQQALDARGLLSEVERLMAVSPFFHSAAGTQCVLGDTAARY